MTPAGRAGRLPAKRHSVKRKLVPPPSRCKPHAIDDIHFARLGETRSWLQCHCGERFAYSDPVFWLSHAMLAEAHSSHKAAPGYRAASKHEVAMAD